MRLIVFITALLLTLPVQAGATSLPVNPDRNEPLEITADHTLEWHRDSRQYIARGNVIAKQGDVTIKADMLTADYREARGSSMEIYKLSATGNVRIISQGNTATGDEAVYDVDRGLAEMTGRNLQLESPEQRVTARDKFEYFIAEGRLTATGDARVIRKGEQGEDTLNADTVTAIFEERPNGEREIKSLRANGNVIVITPAEELRGDRGIYTAATNIAEITGNVSIKRGPNMLEGQRAEVDLTTNVSKMHGGSSVTQTGDGRVRGIFYPGSEQTPTD